MYLKLKKQLKKNGIEGKDNILKIMQERANEVLDYFDVKSVPKDGVPIIKILTDIGIKVYRDDSLPQELSAFIAIDPVLMEKFGTNKIVCVNGNDSVQHIRFALAHELAHYLFDFDETIQTKYYNTYIADDSEKDKDIEVRANKFAACLLMPEKEFREAEEMYYSQNGDRVETISSLINHFGVSAKAIYRRFEELGIGGYER